MRSLKLGILVVVATTALSACGHRTQNAPQKGARRPESQQQQINQLPPSLQQKVDKVKADLEAKGYEVGQGYMSLFTIDDCKYMVQAIGNCLGNNPAAPYIVPSVPLWPDEYADPKLKDAFGPAPNNTWGTYRLDEREAIVILGELPPPAKYFGRLTYVFSRQGIINPADPVYQSVTDPRLKQLLFQRAPDPARSVIAGTIGNSQNNVTIKQASGAAFGQERYFITTADQVMDREMRAALLRAGVPNANQIYTDPVAKDLVRVGLNAEADDLTMLIRYARPEDEQAADRWRQRLPMTVLRVRDKNKQRKTEPFPTPAYDPRTAKSELGLEGDLSNLVRAVKQQWGQPDAPEQRFQSLEETVDLIGQHCIQRPMNCLGDIQDQDFRIALPASIDAGEVLAVVGTLGTATGNATYSSIAVNRSSVLTGVGNVFDVEMAGSANSFGKTVKNTEKLYAYYFARDCTGLSNCFTVTEEMIPKGESITFVSRDYIVPGTTRGADPALRLNATTIILDGKKRPASQG